jgi:hypothetical protein
LPGTNTSLLQKSVNYGCYVFKVQALEGTILIYTFVVTRTKVLAFLVVSCGSTVVEQPTDDFKFKGLNTASAGRVREKKATEVFNVFFFYILLLYF